MADMTQLPSLQYPFGEGSVVVVEPAAELNVTVDNRYTRIEIGPGSLDVDATLNLINTNIPGSGDRLDLEFVCGDTPQTLTLGTGCEVATIPGLADNSTRVSLVHNGTEYRITTISNV